MGGFVLTQGPLTRLVPVENASMPDRSIIQWDKDDLDAVGLLKVDVLALGMLSAIRRALDFVSAKRGVPLTPLEQAAMLVAVLWTAASALAQTAQPAKPPEAAPARTLTTTTPAAAPAICRNPISADARPARSPNGCRAVAVASGLTMPNPARKMITGTR